jgi:hypothetical protein
MFGFTKSTDRLNEAHTLGLGALQAFEDLASDLEAAAEMAEEHGTETSVQALVLQQESESAYSAADRYAAAAGRIRGLVSA